MRELKCKYTNPRVYGKWNKDHTKYSIEPGTIKQLETICSQPLAYHTSVALMPDGHLGAGVSIGTTIHLKDPRKKWQVSPTIISGDIGCGVLATAIGTHHIYFPLLDKVVNQNIPCGFHVNTKPAFIEFSQAINDELDFKTSKRIRHDIFYALGSLGSGNHFIELDKDKHGTYWLVIHCGSRHFGTDIMDHYMKLVGNDKREIKIYHIINTLKAQGKQREIESTLEEWEAKHPKSNSIYRTLYGKHLTEYLHDTLLGQEWASMNRRIICHRIFKAMGWKAIDQFETIHNYFNPKDDVIRKGSVSAHKGEKLIIPLNMRDGSLICIGKGNKDWNYSAPHGAGRAMSRHIAKQNISMKQYRKDMQGIYTSSLNKSTIDEAPEAYKPMQDIIDTISPTAKIVDRIKPVYSYKAHATKSGINSAPRRY